MATARFILRKDSAANWSSANPTLEDGEPGYDTTNDALKIGDGVTAWNSLASVGGAVTSVDGDTGAVDLSSSYVPSYPQLRQVATRLAQGRPMFSLNLNDSTGNGSTEWFRQHLTDLGPLVPARTITTRLWDDSGQGWGGLVTVQTGTDGDRYFVPVAGSDYMEAADAAGHDVTDLDVRVKYAADDWTPSVGTSFIAGREGTSTNRCWWLSILAGGTLRLYWFPDGTTGTQVTADSTATISATDGDALWLRYVIDADNGAGGYDVKFYTSTTGADGSWVQLGATVTGGATTTVFQGAAKLTFGGRAGGTSPLAGKAYAMEMRAGIDGIVVASLDCDHLEDNSLDYIDETGTVWTSYGDPSLVGAKGWLALNAATAGADVSYFTDGTRWGKLTQLPTIPLVYLALGHNAGTSVTYAGTFKTLLDQVLTKYPSAARFVSIQNPQTTAATNPTQHATRQRQVAELCAVHGIPSVDVYQAFLDYDGDWEADLMADTVHPNEAGSIVWADLVSAAFSVVL